MRRAREVALGAVLLRLLDLVGSDGPQGGAFVLPRANEQPFDTDAPRNPKLLGTALATFALGSVVMLGFDSGLARVVGVLLLVTFVVTGLFAVIDPRWLAGDDDERPG